MIKFIEIDELIKMIESGNVRIGTMDLKRDCHYCMVKLIFTDQDGRLLGFNEDDFAKRLGELLQWVGKPLAQHRCFRQSKRYIFDQGGKELALTILSKWCKEFQNLADHEKVNRVRDFWFEL